MRLDRDEDADHDDHHRAGDDADRARDGGAEAAQRTHDLAADLLDVDGATGEVHRTGPGEDAIDLHGHRFLQPLELADQFGAGIDEGPDDETDRGDGDDRQPPAAADRQHPAEQAGAAVQHRGKDDAGEDQHQWLGEHDHAEDGEDHAGPDHRLLQFLADDRIAEFDRTGLFEVVRFAFLDAGGRDAHGRGAPWVCGSGTLSGCSEVNARPPRKAVNQLTGFQ